MRNTYFILLSVVLCMTVGCATQHAIQEWKQKANGIAVGTPRNKIECILPPTSIVLDLRSGAGAAGPVAYWVDDTTAVKLWYDGQNRLGKPIVVEQKKRPEKANK